MGPLHGRPSPLQEALRVRWRLAFASVVALGSAIGGCGAAAEADDDAISSPSLIAAGEQGLPLSCPVGVLKRKEFRNLSRSEWNEFVHAVQAEMLGASPTPYDATVRTHLVVAGSVYGYPLFFPFLRAYLSSFERRLQRSYPTITIPYWDSSLDAQAPEQSPVFRPEFMGGNGVREGECVLEGPFGGWKPRFPSSHCLRRAFDRAPRIAPWPSSERVASWIESAPNYHALRVAIENNVDGAVHNGMGGDMMGMQAPNDPIFWLHAAYVDKIWADWQDRATFPRDYGGTTKEGRQAQLSDPIAPFPLTVGNVMDTARLCYEYEGAQPSDAGAPVRPRPSGTQP
jgi:tyrosinase